MNEEKREPRMFEVEVWREIREFTTIEVEAVDEADAKDQAETMIDDAAGWTYDCCVSAGVTSAKDSAS